MTKPSRCDALLAAIAAELEARRAQIDGDAKWKLLKETIGGALITAAVTAAITIPLTHPDMTNTRLFLEFWWGYLGILVAVSVGVWIWTR